MASEDRIPPATGRPEFAEHAPEFHLWDYIAVVLKRLPMAAVIFCSVILLGLLYTLTRTPTYRAITRILINPTAVDLTRAEGAVELGAPTGADFIPTQVKLVTSAPVLDRVLERLNLREEAPFADARDPRRMLAERISVTQVRGARLLDVAVTATDPRRAAAIANMTVTCYMESAREKRIGVSKEGVVQLNNRAEVLRLKMVEASAQVQQFLTTNSITSFASAQRLVEDRMRGSKENKPACSVKSSDRKCPRWPPASRPWAITASTPCASSHSASVTVVADAITMLPQPFTWASSSVDGRPK